MRTLSLRAFASVLFISLLAAPAAMADNSSPASTGSNTTGYNVDPALEPGAVETRKFETAAKAGTAHSSAAGGGMTFQGNARVPLHFWGKSDDEYAYRHGVLAEPGVAVRVDTAKGNVNRLQLDATGVAAYRFQGTNIHSTEAALAERKRYEASVSAKYSEFKEALQKDYNRFMDRVEMIRVANRDAVAALEMPRDKKEIEAKAELTKAIAQEIKAALAASPVLLASLERHSTERGTDEQVLNRYSQAAAQILADGRATVVALGDANRNAVQQTSDEKANPIAKQTEASGTGEVILGRAGYRYHDIKDVGIKQNGAVLTPVALSGSAAVRINKLVNVGICGAAKPVEFLAGQNKGVSFISTGLEGCLDVTVGELPTIRDRAGVNYAFDTRGEDPGNNSRFVFSNELTVSKKLGPITPEAGWKMEKDCVGGFNSCVNRTMFTAGAGF